MILFLPYCALDIFTTKKCVIHVGEYVSGNHFFVAHFYGLGMGIIQQASKKA